jgi:hypothetical protein
MAYTHPTSKERNEGIRDRLWWAISLLCEQELIAQTGRSNSSGD